MDELTLRRWGASDCRRIWEWANDATVRAVSFSQEEIPWEDHQRWFAARLQDADTIGYVVLDGERPVGQVRFDLGQDDTAVISVSIDASQRGRGLGHRAIALGCRALHESHPQLEVLAYILPDNRASLEAFSAAGFGPAEDCEYRGTPAKVQRLGAPEPRA